jgi:hypothetical protein
MLRSRGTTFAFSPPKHGENMEQAWLSKDSHEDGHA